MAKSTMKLLMFFLCINICFYIGGFRVIHDDFLNQFFDTSEQNETLILSGPSANLTGSVPQDLEISSAQESDNSWKMTDVFKTLWGFITFLLNTAFMPLSFFTDTSLGLPWVVRIIFGAPLTIAYLLAILSWFKGQD